MRFDFIAFWNANLSTWQAGLTTHAHQYQGAATLREAVDGLKASLDPYSDWFQRLDRTPDAQYVPTGDERDYSTAYLVTADDGDGYDVEPSKTVRYEGQILTPSLFEHLTSKWLKCDETLREALLSRLMREAHELKGDESVTLLRLVALMQNCTEPNTNNCVA